MNRTRLGALTLTLALAAAACGSDEEATSAAATADDSAAESSDDAMEGMDMDGMEGMAMNMGDASAVRADEVVGAALAMGDFELLDTRPQGFDDTTGTAWIARHSAGTTVTAELSGLIPDTAYISHVHADVCANEGGDHYQFEIGGSEFPPNEIHLAFTSDSEGNGFMTAENSQIAGLDAVAFIVHPADLIDNKVACVDFVELEEGAAAAALDAGVDPSLVDDTMEMDGMEMDGMEMDGMEMDDMHMDDMDGSEMDDAEMDGMEMDGAEHEDGDDHAEHEE